MTLPFSPDVDFAPGSIVPSETLDRIQRCIVQGAHGLKTLVLSPFIGAPDEDWGFGGDPISNWGLNGSGESHAVYPIPLDVGSRIREIRGYVLHINGPIRMRAYRNAAVVGATGAGVVVSTQIGADQTSPGPDNPLGVMQLLTIGSLTTTIMAASAYEVWFDIDIPTTLAGLFHVEVDYDRPVDPP